MARHRCRVSLLITSLIARTRVSRGAGPGGPRYRVRVAAMSDAAWTKTGSGEALRRGDGDPSSLAVVLTRRQEAADGSINAEHAARASPPPRFRIRPAAAAAQNASRLPCGRQHHAGSRTCAGWKPGQPAFGHRTQASGERGTSPDWRRSRTLLRFSGRATGVEILRLARGT